MENKTRLMKNAEGALKAAKQGKKTANSSSVRTSAFAYGAAISPAIANLVDVNLKLTKMLLPPPIGLPPVAATTPPFKVSIASINVAISAATAVSTAISSTTGLSVLNLGAPLEPGFSLGVDSVVGLFDVLIETIDKLLVKPQK